MLCLKILLFIESGRNLVSWNLFWIIYCKNMSVQQYMHQYIHKTGRKTCRTCDLPIKPECGFKADQLLLLPHLQDVAQVDARLSVEHESVLCILSLYETCMRRGSLSWVGGLSCKLYPGSSRILLSADANIQKGDPMPRSNCSLRMDPSDPIVPTPTQKLYRDTEVKRADWLLKALLQPNLAVKLA